MKNLGKLSLNLAGGGARGIWQLGCLKAWRDSGLQYDMLFGTSVGALSGAMLHQGELDELENLWLNIKNDWVYRVWPWDLFKSVTSAACFYDSKPLRQLCDKYINPDKIRANQKPFYVNATQIYPDPGPLMYDLRTLNNVEMPQFVKASANAPVYFGPETFQGMKLIDGGIVNNFSVMAALAAGADTIVVITPTIPEPINPNNILDMLNILTSLPEYEFLQREMDFIDFLDEVQAPFPDLKHVNRVLIQPKEPLDIGLLDFNYKQDRKQLIQQGYDTAMGIIKSELL